MVQSKNIFTTTQLDVIRELAGEYWDSNNMALDVFDDDINGSGKARYVESIVAGLIDPDYWGD